MPKASQKLYKRCRECHKPDYPAWSQNSLLNAFCGPVCAATNGSRKAAERRVKAARAETRAQREANKTLGQWTKEAQAEFNAFIRQRDAGKPCISCGAIPPVVASLTVQSFDAGHYRSRGAAPHLRFHISNCFAQCKRCNRDLSGNVVEMRKGMVARIGEARVQALEHDDRPRKYTAADLKRIKLIFRRRRKLYQKIREKHGVPVEVFRGLSG